MPARRLIVEPQIDFPPLGENDVHVWTIKSTAVTNPGVLEACRAVMSAEETEKQQRFLFEKDRHQCLVTRGFVRAVLSAYAPVEPKEWEFVLGKQGKPRIEAPSEYADLSFNLSHTKGMIACGVARELEIGVDVEFTGRRVDLNVADRFFAAPEVARLRSLPAKDQLEAFFHYWTLKESYIKARGLGLAIPLGDFWFHYETEPIEIGFSTRLQDDPTGWRFEMQRIGKDHQLAVGIRRKHGGQAYRFRFLPPSQVDLATVEHGKN